MVGFLSNDTGSYRSGMLFLGGCALAASLLVLTVRAPARDSADAPRTMPADGKSVQTAR